MAGDSACFGVHEDRIVETEFRNAGSDLCDLRFRMSPRVSCVR